MRFAYADPPYEGMASRYSREAMARGATSSEVSPRMGVRPRQTNGALGAKPPAFCRWVLDALGYDPGQDTIDDLFPGSGVMGRVAAQGILVAAPDGSDE